LAADHPILFVFTIVYGHYPCSLYIFQNKGGRKGSKELPAIWRCCYLYCDL